MRAHSSRRLAGRLLLLAVLAMVVATTVVAPASPAPVFRPSSLLLAVSGTHNFGVAGTWAVSGNATIISKLYPGDPCRLLVAVPTDPCRVLTIASVVRASNNGGASSCLFTGSTSRAVPVTDTQTTVDAVVTPTIAAAPQEPCAPLAAFSIRYVVGFAGDGTITSATATTEPVT
jgi:hypothetical protein